MIALRARKLTRKLIEVIKEVLTRENSRVEEGYNAMNKNVNLVNISQARTMCNITYADC